MQQLLLQLKHTILLTMPSWGLGWVPFSQPDACVLHLFFRTQVAGIFEPAVLLKRYHPAASVLSHLRCDEPWVTNITLRSVSRLTMYELHSGSLKKERNVYYSKNRRVFIETRRQATVWTWKTNKAPLTPKYFFFAKMNLCTCWKRIAAIFSFFLQILAFYRHQNLRKTKHLLFKTESEREWVYSWFDVTIYFECMFTKS